METCLLTIWLWSGGPMIAMHVPDCCNVGARWQERAAAWAKRSALRPDEPIYLCELMAEPFLLETTR